MDMDTVMMAPPLKKGALIDPRSKIVLFFVIGFLVFSNISKPLEIGLMCVLACLLIFGGQTRTALTGSLIFIGMLLLDIFVAPQLPGPFGAIFLTLVRFPRFLIPIFMAGTLMIKTTTVSEFIGAFHKMHITEKIIIPFSVMFRFIPTVKEEWQSIRNAMKFRGIGISFKTVFTHPMMTLEYVLVPLLMSAATISEELAAASLSRGLDTNGKRTCITDVHLRLIDYGIFLGCGLLILYQGVFN